MLRYKMIKQYSADTFKKQGLILDKAIIHSIGIQYNPVIPSSICPFIQVRIADAITTNSPNLKLGGEGTCIANAGLMIQDLLKLFNVTSTIALEGMVCLIVFDANKQPIGISPDGNSYLLIKEWLQDKPDKHASWLGDYMLCGGSGVMGD
jgi:hypothetical protein